MNLTPLADALTAANMRTPAFRQRACHMSQPTYFNAVPRTPAFHQWALAVRAGAAK